MPEITQERCEIIRDKLKHLLKTEINGVNLYVPAPIRIILQDCLELVEILLKRREGE